MIPKAKKRILIILGSDFHARSYFEGGIHKNLLEHFEIHLLVDSRINNSLLPKYTNLDRIEFDQSTLSLFERIMPATLIRNIHKSTSFKFRVRRWLFGDYRDQFMFRKKGIRILLRGVKYSLPLYYKYKVRMYLSCVLATIMKVDIADFKPDLVVSWAQSIEPTAVLAVELAEKFDSKSILVFDNWDNLSSKAVLLKSPDAIVCFGPQMQQLASKIHGIPINKIHPLGSSRFDVYPKAQRVFSPHSKRKILVAGSSIALEDSSILDAVSAIKKYGKTSISKQLAFTYRPHPAPQGMSLNLENWDYPDIQIDKGARQLSTKYPVWQNQRELAYELSQYSLVISGPTTLILESLLCNIRVIVPAFENRKVRTSTLLMIKELEHLKELPRLEGVTICDNVESLEKMITDSLNNSTSPIAGETFNFVLTREPGLFSNRLIELFQNVLSAECC